VLSRHLMLWIGERSYSLFLIHFTMFSVVNYVISHFVPQKDMTYFVFSRAFGLPLAFFGAMLLFHFVERRFARNLLTANEFWPPIAGVRHGVGKPAAPASSM
jgi:peptidoglycan/LPS O-acetylase OafA/YrhL